MGFFKSIGNKLKRVISLNNLTRAVSGNFSAIGKDVVRVATTPDPRQTPEQQAEVYNTPNFTFPQIAVDVANDKYASVRSKLIDRASENTVVQTVADTATKIYLKTTWNKYKNWIIGLLAVIVLFVVFRKVIRTATPRRRAR